MKLSDFDTYSKSPYEFPRFRRGTIVKEGHNVTLSDDDGVEVGNFSLGGKQEYKEFDSAPFVKLFDNCFDNGKKLTTPGLRVFFYILTQLHLEDDVVVIRPIECAEYCGYSHRKDIYRGIVDLLENDFIARKTGGANEYFINFNYVFRGDKIKLKNRMLK